MKSPSITLLKFSLHFVFTDDGFDLKRAKKFATYLEAALSCLHSRAARVTAYAEGELVWLEIERLDGGASQFKEARQICRRVYRQFKHRKETSK